MKKMIILGSMGMLGHVVYTYMSSLEKYEIIGVARSKGEFVDKVIDLSDFDKLENLLDDIKPDYIVNCAGVLVQKSSENILDAININSYLPNFISNIVCKNGGKFIHISTDCVFSGKDGNYKESSIKDGYDNYARTKSLGEVSNGNDLTIRTSIIGPELKKNGTGLLHWFLNQKGPINGYKMAYWSGVTTIELANAIEDFIKQNIKGIYNFSVVPKISKYNLLKLISELFNIDIIIHETTNYKIDKSLITERDDFRYKTLTYNQMIIDMKNWILQNKELYLHYGDIF